MARFSVQVFYQGHALPLHSGGENNFKSLSIRGYLVGNFYRGSKKLHHWLTPWPYHGWGGVEIVKVST